jgi:hypothetical protein
LSQLFFDPEILFLIVSNDRSIVANGKGLHMNRDDVATDVTNHSLTRFAFKYGNATWSQLMDAYLTTRATMKNPKGYRREEVELWARTPSLFSVLQCTTAYRAGETAETWAMQIAQRSGGTRN